jgi:hypothetical protein
MDSYLEIARKVLREARQPLSARQILKAAYQLQIVPRDLYPPDDICSLATPFPSQMMAVV